MAVKLSNEFLIKLNNGDVVREFKKYKGPNPNDIDEIIAFCFYGRSGTLFLSSLLEDHPELIKVGDSEFRELFKFFDEMIGRANSEEQVSNLLRHYGIDLEFEGKHVQNFVKIGNCDIHVPADILFSVPEKKADSSNKGPLISDFISAYFQLVEQYYGEIDETVLDEKSFFCVVHLAYNWARGKQYEVNVSKIAWNMHIPDPILTKNVQRFFAKIKVIHMVRNPLQTLGSQFRRYIEPSDDRVKGDVAWHGLANKVLGELLDHDLALIEPRRNDDEFAIRLEDLHSDREMMLRRLAERLGITWDPIMLESTFLSVAKIWKPDQRGAFSKDHLKDDHANLFSENERVMVECIFFDTYQKWNYSFKHLRLDEDRWAYVKKWLPMPMNLELICWKKACESTVVDSIGVSSQYSELRSRIMKRMSRADYPVDVLSL